MTSEVSGSGPGASAGLQSSHSVTIVDRTLVVAGDQSVGEGELLSLADVVEPPCRRHQIDCLGGPTRPHQLGRVGRADPIGDLTPSLFVGDRRASGELVDAAGDVGDVPRVVVVQSLDDRPGLLRGRRAIEVYERLAVDLLIQGREFPLNRERVEGHGVHDVARHFWCAY